MTPEIIVTHYMDAQSGAPAVSLPLTNVNSEVHLYQEDFNRLIETGLDPRWRLSNGQILERGTRLSVTRLVAKAIKGQKVQLKDRDPCNLKRDNIVISLGSGRTNVMDRLSKIEDRPSKFLNNVRLKHNYITPSWIKESNNEND